MRFDYYFARAWLNLLLRGIAFGSNQNQLVPDLLRMLLECG
jgi:hypothetical protein